VPEGEHVVPIGRADIKREGGDVTIICHSKTVSVSLKAAEQLAADGVNAEVLDLRTIRPLDTESILESVGKTHRCVVVEEGWSFAGVGAQVVDTIQREAFDELDAPVARVSGAEVPAPYARNLEIAAFPSAADVIDAVYQVTYRARES
jgi:pyruvate dehydrogenase E1 component beta subunit